MNSMILKIKPKITTVASAVINSAVAIGLIAFTVISYNTAQAQAAIAAEQAIVSSRLDTITMEDRHCLSQNIFFEARNQTVQGQVAVAWVTLNRMEDDRFPGSICRVVRQSQKDANGQPIKNKCQFSWYCDGKSDIIPTNIVAQRAWEDAMLIADVVLLDWARGLDSPVEHAVMYHAYYVRPNWRKSFDPVAVVDDHIFYQ